MLYLKFTGRHNFSKLNTMNTKAKAITVGGNIMIDDKKSNANYKPKSDLFTINFAPNVNVKKPIKPTNNIRFIL